MVLYIFYWLLRRACSLWERLTSSLPILIFGGRCFARFAITPPLLYERDAFGDLGSVNPNESSLVPDSFMSEIGRWCLSKKFLFISFYSFKLFLMGYGWFMRGGLLERLFDLDFSTQSNLEHLCFSILIFYKRSFSSLILLFFIRSTFTVFRAGAISLPETARSIVAFFGFDALATSCLCYVSREVSLLTEWVEG